VLLRLIESTWLLCLLLIKQTKTIIVRLLRYLRAAPYHSRLKPNEHSRLCWPGRNHLMTPLYRIEGTRLMLIRQWKTTALQLLRYPRETPYHRLLERNEHSRL
jgi:hypothetical protein